MTDRSFATWAFLAAAVIFLCAALEPLLKGGRVSVTFFVLSMAFFVIGSAAARKRKSTPHTS